MQPERRTIERTVSQPAFVNAFEQTALYPKISGYIKQWSVNIGDTMHKDDLMVDLFVPELQAEYEQKKAEVTRDEVLIEVAKKRVEVAESQCKYRLPSWSGRRPTWASIKAPSTAGSRKSSGLPSWLVSE